MSVYVKTVENLNTLASGKFKEFSSKIINSNKPLIGVKIPTLKEIAKSLLNGGWQNYLIECKFKYFEDTLIYGLIIAKLEKDEFYKYIGVYLSQIDSWAHVDGFVPQIKFIKKDKENFFREIEEKIFSSQGFYLRYYLICPLNYFLEEYYLEKIFKTVEKVDGKGYYNDMAIAWLISVAFVKFERETLDFIKNCKLSDFTLNKSISKIRDSFRVTPENKVLVQNFIRKKQ